MPKRVIRDYKFQKPDEENKQLINVTVEVVLEKIREGYRFSARDKSMKIKDIEEFDAKAVVSQLALENPEEAEKFILELAWRYTVAPQKRIRLPEIEFSDYNGRKGVGVGLADLILFVEKDKSWKFKLFDTQEKKSLTPPFHVLSVEALKKESMLKEALKLKFKARLVSLIVGKIVEVIESQPVETWKVEKIEKEKKAIPVVKAELPISEDVSDVFAYKGDRKFNSKIQIKSLGFPKSRFLDLEFQCHHSRGELCNLCNFEGYSMSFEENFDASAFATYFDSNNPKDSFNVLKQKGLVEGCDRVTARGDKETAITQAVVSDRVGNEAKAWFVHSRNCDLRRGPNWIYAKGWLCRGRYGRIGVLVLEFQAESEVMQPDEETVQASKQYLQKIACEDEANVWKVAKAMRKKCNLKGDESTRGFVADFLTIGAPVWVKTPEGPAQIAMTSIELGGTTTAKSQREREIIVWLKAGKYESGRKTSAGLAAGAEKIEGMGWVMRKGLLPSADLSFLILDNMYPNALNEFIESRRNGVIMLSTIKSCELWARARLKLLSNPALPFEQHIHKCVALKVYDSKFIARFTFVNFTYGVAPAERYNPAVESLSEDEESLLNAVWNVLRWNLSQEVTYTVPLELWPLIMGLSKQLELTFGNEEIPLFLRANPHKLSTLAYCFALFEGAEPTERHVKQAYKWLTECGRDIELDQFTEQWKSEHTLSNEEYQNLRNAINEKILEEMQTLGGEFKETVVYKFLEYVARHGQAQMEEIAASMQISDTTIKRRAKEMKGLRLIKSSRQGYFFTVKGVRFWKRWLKEGLNRDPVDLEDLDSERQRLTNEEKRQKTFQKFTLEQGVTPENEAIGSIGVTVEKRISQPMFQVKTWCRTYRDQRSEIDLVALAKFIRQELKQDPQRVIKKAFETGILMKSPELGKAVVV